ncbi:MAG: AsmA family protein, partial [Rhodospirillaceae bacterium]|nr:AsmA family protein [Rhodospirillaceae bacterium]
LSALSGGGGGGKSKGGGGSGAPWSREPLDTTPLTAFDADLALTAGTIALENDRIDDFDAKLTLADGVLTIDRLAGKTKGGSIDVKGELRGRGVPVAALTVAASNIEIGELVHAGGMRVRGPLSLDGDFKASGVSMAEMIDALSGKGRIDGTLTVLSETERVAGSGLLAGLGLRVQELAGLTDIVGSVLGGYIGRPSKLAGNFAIERGILSTQDTALTNDQAKALTHGKVNLSAWTLDTVTDFYRGTGAGSPWLSLGLTGRIDGPNVRLAGLALSPENLLPGTIEQLQSAPSGVLDQVVPGLLPGLSKPGASSSTGGTTTQPLESLQDAVKGILGGESAARPAAQPQTQTAPQPEAAPSEPKKKTSPLDEILPGVKGLFGQ